MHECLSVDSGYICGDGRVSTGDSTVSGITIKHTYTTHIQKKERKWSEEALLHCTALHLMRAVTAPSGPLHGCGQTCPTPPSVPCPWG